MIKQVTKAAHALHIHTLLIDGTRTGADIPDPEDSNRHWHEVNGERTSTELYAVGQVHEFRGELTSLPINIAENDPMNTTGGHPVEEETDRDDEDEDRETSGGHEDNEDDKTQGMNSLETKYCGFNQTLEIKEDAVNGVTVGTIKGYIATWDLDRGLDRFVRGAFEEALTELRAKNRAIRFKDHHFRTIGRFPIDKVFEDGKGLFAEGEINLEVQQGKEAFALVKQGAISDFSIGFTASEVELDEDIRNILKAFPWEGSLVDEPMNPAAVVTEVKAVVPFQDLPLADRNRRWDSTAAIARIREFTESGESPSAKYRRAFVWFDSAESTLFGSYKLPIADVIGGQMVAVPRAIFAAAAALQGARGGVDIPEADRPKVIRHLERYYAKMDLDSPFADKQYFVSDDVKTWGRRDVERFLRKTGEVSKSAAKNLASRIDKDKQGDYNGGDIILTDFEEDWNKVLEQIKSIRL